MFEDLRALTLFDLLDSCFASLVGEIKSRFTASFVTDLEQNKMVIKSFAGRRQQ